MPDRIESLATLLDPTGKALLVNHFAGVIENVMASTISSQLKNNMLSGAPNSGTVIVRRLANAESKAYGTARAAGAGDKVKQLEVVIPLDQNREIIEELEEKDVRLLGVDGYLARRERDHRDGMVRELETTFFAEMAGAATAYTPAAGAPLEEIISGLVTQLVTTRNKYVNGVPRDRVSIIASPVAYDKLRNYLDKVSTPNVNTAPYEFGTYHGVRVYNSIYLPSDVAFIAASRDAVAQPVFTSEPRAEKIPLSDAYGVAFFFYYGTKAITPDLIYKVDAAALP